MLCLMLLFSLQTGAGAAPAATPGKAGEAARGIQLLQKAQEAMGGADKLAAVKDTTQTMVVTLAPPFDRDKVTQTSRFLAPSEIRQEQDGRIGKTVVYFDGASGQLTTKRGTTQLSMEAILAARGVLFRQPCTLMLSDRDRSRAVKAVGANTVEISTSDGQQVKVEFDPKTGLPLRQSYKVSSNGKPVTRTDTFSDWRDVNGLRFPFHAVQADDDKKVLELTVSGYKVNSGLTSAELSKPPR